MLQFFRNFFKSKIGIAVTLIFLVIIAIAFGIGSVASSGSFGGPAATDKVAVVGDAKIDATDLTTNASSAFEQARQRNPNLTMQQFVAQGGVDSLLGQMIDRVALAQMGEKYGLRAGTRLVDSEIVKTPQFQGVDGKFDANAFRAALRQRGLTEKEVRSDMSNGLFARQLITPVAISPQVPDSIAKRYTQLLQERRKGNIMVIPAAAFAPKDGPTDQQLQTYYDAHKSDYMRPERRVIRYASFDENAISNVTAPTEDEIKARYERDKTKYEASETRSFTQLVLPSEAEAKAVAEAVRNGTSLAKAAQDKGLATTTVSSTTQGDFAGQTSTAVAAAGFAAAKGALSAPAQGPLGWYLLKVDSIEQHPARSLDQVRSQIAADLTEEKRRKELNDATSRIDDEFTNGKSLSQVAQEMKLTLQSTKPLTSDGQVYGTQESAPPVLARVLSTAFQMQESQPQIAEVVPGQTFLIYDVSDIIPSAVAPLAEIKDQVTRDWRLNTAMTKAGEAADRILERVKNGKTLAEAASAEHERLPPPEPVNRTRQEVVTQRGMPPVLALYFSMAKGTTKKLESTRAGVWFVVQVNDVVEPDIPDNDPAVATTQNQLQQTVSDEYIQEFLAATRDQITIHRNQAAIETVTKQITGQGN